VPTEKPKLPLVDKIFKINFKISCTNDAIDVGIDREVFTASKK